MKDILRIGSRLALICAVAAITLALFNTITEPRIAAYNEKILQEALAKLSLGLEVGEFTDSSSIETITNYYTLLKDAEKAGYIFEIEASGYGGSMKLLASYDIDGKLLAAQLLDNAETPGLGKNAEKSEYMKMFIGKAGNAIPLKKSQLPPAEADSVSGASITFSGVAKGLYAGSEAAISLGGKK